MILKRSGTGFLSADTYYSLKASLIAVVSYFTFWMSYFILFRGIFLLYHHELSSQIEPKLILGTFYHGLKMDISFSAYLTLLILVVLSLSALLTSRTITLIISLITVFFLILISIISVADLELYREWGFRFDATPLMYLNTPGEMAASVASSPYLLLITGIVVTFLLSYWIFLKWLRPLFLQLQTPKLGLSLVYLLAAGLMIIPIRGGLQLAPMNQSVAFFSKSDFANQAAINVPWNFFWSLTKQLYSRTNPYEFLPEPEANELIEGLYQEDTSISRELLVHSKPNIVVILWESLTSKVIPELGGTFSDVVPEFRSLMKEGVLFDNFYANGNRSDKGIVAVLSGFPAQPKRSIIKIPTKSSKLPVITKPLAENGYYTGYFHGGELEFANIKSYLINANFNTIVGKDSFDKSDMNSKWGAHDHILLEKALRDISDQPQPFFNVVFTLSSHEPFDIPVDSQFPGNDLENQYKSALYYTDQALGSFIRQAKQQSWYDSSLIIILADHGHRLLGDNPRYEKDRFHIPMLWLGGALKVKDSVVHKTCSQTDLPMTLLSQLGIGNHDFKWSRNIMNSSTESGAFYIYNEGIGYVQEGDYLVYDHPSDKVLVKTEGMEEENLIRARAHLQLTYQDYLNK